LLKIATGTNIETFQLDKMMRQVHMTKQILLHGREAADRNWRKWILIRQRPPGDVHGAGAQ